MINLGDEPRELTSNSIMGQALQDASLVDPDGLVHLYRCASKSEVPNLPCDCGSARERRQQRSVVEGRFLPCGSLIRKLAADL